jgi:hypothetical protein
MAKAKIIRVWGLASGRNGTSDAARGAFTWHDYETLEAANAARATDWLNVFWAEKADAGLLEIAE